MSKNYLSLPYTQIRRQDRAITDDEWIRAFLRWAPYGTLATVHEGQPFINSNLYVYDEAANVIYIHTARVGRTRANLEKEEHVCFNVSQMGRLLPADEAQKFSVEYASVTVFGTGEVISDPIEAEHGLQLLLDKYAPHLRPGRDYRPITMQELNRTTVYRIIIEQWSAKKKTVASDFPGAFYYGESRE